MSTTVCSSKPPGQAKFVLVSRGGPRTTQIIQIKKDSVHIGNGPTEVFSVEGICEVVPLSEEKCESRGDPKTPQMGNETIVPESGLFFSIDEEKGGDNTFDLFCDPFYYKLPPKEPDKSENLDKLDDENPENLLSFSGRNNSCYSLNCLDSHLKSAGTFSDQNTSYSQTSYNSDNSYLDLPQSVFDPDASCSSLNHSEKNVRVIRDSSLDYSTLCPSLDYDSYPHPKTIRPFSEGTKPGTFRTSLLKRFLNRYITGYFL